MIFESALELFEKEVQKELDQLYREAYRKIRELRRIKTISVQKEKSK